MTPQAIKNLVTLLLCELLLVRSNDLQKHLDDLQVSGRYGTELLGSDEELLVLSTLDGSLIGVNPLNGDVRWNLKNEPAVKVPVDTKNAISPLFLPDPKDGSLYLLNPGEAGVLKKLPFSIQQLVASSPCKSSDGIFYTGKKIDSWLSIDWKTGKKTSVLSFDALQKTCPLSSSNSLFIGRTEYSILMYDSNRDNRQWNVTFYDYSSRVVSSDELNKYGFVHVGGSATGRVRRLERRSGSVLWEQDYGSPLVALYTKQGQDIVALPFTSIADASLDSIPFHHHDNFLSTLYIGEHRHGLYALPSLAGRDLPLLSVQDRPRLLLEGPNALGTNQIVTLGHYQLPDVSKTQLRITGRSDPVIPGNSSGTGSLSRRQSQDSGAHDPHHRHPKPSAENFYLTIFVGLLTVSVIVMFGYIKAQMRDIQSSRGSSNGSTGSGFAVETQYGIITIGKISFNTQLILGKGCEGTFVFRGEFDGRGVAVKRLLPDCFTVADREVSLLRESDAHPNVIRYFCMEQDPQFRYIALELCSATLQDYVEKGIHKDDIEPKDVLKQASSGLGHLHSLSIVHRDVKPHNILLNGGRVMISDFGLCKKLQNGKASFSRRSGITGTDGWIAPEMIDSKSRTMCAVDIFSFGCVFYYVMTDGKHPFGEPLRRQANILAGEYRLSELSDKLWKTLIKSMISVDPHERPSIQVVLKHPVFWDKALILTFLQDVSDRLEKEDGRSETLLRLETGGSEVCGEDWRNKIDPEVAQDIKKYRSYRPDSVRDLLRAIRNKKHHYRELCTEAQEMLGESAESYLDYWSSHFPWLVYHSWVSLQSLQREPAFAQYYHQGYTFPSEKESSQLPAWIYEIPVEKGKNGSPQKKAKRSSPGKTRSEKEDGSPTKEIINEEEMKNWIKAGREQGAWRPQSAFKPRVNRRRDDTRKLESNSFVWKVPPS